MKIDIFVNIQQTHILVFVLVQWLNGFLRNFTGINLSLLYSNAGVKHAAALTLCSVEN
jgi:hypothetical protein